MDTRKEKRLDVKALEKIGWAPYEEIQEPPRDVEEGEVDDMLRFLFFRAPPLVKAVEFIEVRYVL